MTRSLYSFHAIDRPDVAALRGSLREEHRTSIRRADPMCRCVLGGPLLDEAGVMIGTALAFEADSADDVFIFMAEDPYMKANLFDHVEIREWRIGLGSIV